MVKLVRVEATISDAHCSLTFDINVSASEPCVVACIGLSLTKVPTYDSLQNVQTPRFRSERSGLGTRVQLRVGGLRRRLPRLGG